jgi:hypothetical protein
MSYGSNTTTLEAVNQMLSTIGQSRISTLATAGEANDAQKILAEVDRAVQSEGWHFNRYNNIELPVGTAYIDHTTSGSAITTSETNPHLLLKDEKVLNNNVALTVASVDSAITATLSAAPTGQRLFYTQRIAVPTDILNMDTSIYTYTDIDPIVRGKFLYDRRDNTYFFTEAVKATLTYQVPFEGAASGEQSLPEYARRYIVTKAARVFASRHVGDKELVQMVAQEEMEARMNLIHKESENADYSIFSSPLAYYTVSRGNPSGFTQPVASGS